MSISLNILKGIKIRKLFFGNKVNSLEEPIDLIVHTKAPEKWILIDLENLKIYKGQVKKSEYGLWKRIFKGFK